MNLKNKKIIITGASGGIGHSLVKKFSEFDSTVLATGTNIEKLNNLKKEFPKIKIKQTVINVIKLLPVFDLEPQQRRE